MCGPCSTSAKVTRSTAQAIPSSCCGPLQEIRDRDAMNWLADAYSCGTQVERNLETSQLWLERAASVGSAAAMRKLAMAARRPEGGEDYLRPLERAAQSEDPDPWFFSAGPICTALEYLLIRIRASVGSMPPSPTIPFPCASIALARLVTAGAADTPPNPERAKQYLLAMKGGNSSLMYELGKLYSSKGATADEQRVGREYFATRLASGTSPPCSSLPNSASPPKKVAAGTVDLAE